MTLKKIKNKSRKKINYKLIKKSKPVVSLTTANIFKIDIKSFRKDNDGKFKKPNINTRYDIEKDIDTEFKKYIQKLPKSYSKRRNKFSNKKNVRSKSMIEKSEPKKIDINNIIIYKTEPRYTPISDIVEIFEKRKSLRQISNDRKKVNINNKKQIKNEIMRKSIPLTHLNSTKQENYFIIKKNVIAIYLEII